jgi:hypothetical protein
VGVGCEQLGLLKHLESALIAPSSAFCDPDLTNIRCLKSFSFQKKKQTKTKHQPPNVAHNRRVNGHWKVVQYSKRDK